MYDDEREKREKEFLPQNKLKNTTKEEIIVSFSKGRCGAI